MGGNAPGPACRGRKRGSGTATQNTGAPDAAAWWADGGARSDRRGSSRVVHDVPGGRKAGTARTVSSHSTSTNPPIPLPTQRLAVVQLA